MLEQELVIERRSNEDLRLEQQKMQTCIKSLTEERSALERDKSWLKTLIQNLIEVIQRSDVKGR